MNEMTGHSVRDVLLINCHCPAGRAKCYWQEVHFKLAFDCNMFTFTLLQILQFTCFCCLQKLFDYVCSNIVKILNKSHHCLLGYIFRVNYLIWCFKISFQSCVWMKHLQLFTTWTYSIMLCILGASPLCWFWVKLLSKKREKQLLQCSWISNNHKHTPEL